LEYDLSKFFDQVRMSSTLEELVKLGLPTEIEQELLAINRGSAKLPATEKLDESQQRSKKMYEAYEREKESNLAR